MILETLVLHASDWIEWLDASGPQGVTRRLVPSQSLDIRLSQAPSDLQLVAKAAGVALWRQRPEGLRKVVAGQASPADLAVVDEALFPVAGEVRDPAGRFLPRRFAIAAGRAAGHRLHLYRSPHGTRFGKAGGLYGRTTLDDGTPVPWALLELRVSPPLADPLDFLAQSDAQGEFRLSLERLPTLTRDAPAATYPARLRLRAAALSTDPDTLPAAQLRGGGDPPFAAELDLEIAPGSVARLASPGRNDLVLTFP